MRAMPGAKYCPAKAGTSGRVAKSYSEREDMEQTVVSGGMTMLGSERGSRWMLIVAAGLLALMAGAVCAATVDTQVTQVALFKNGLAFFTRQGDLPKKAGPVEIGPLPAASHGTFWLGWSPQARIENLATEPVDVMEGRLAVTIPELLKANVGKRVRLEFASEFRAALQGVLKSFPEAADREPVNPYMTNPIRPDTPTPGLVIIETADGTVAIHPNSVDRIVFLQAAQTTVSDEFQRMAVRGTLAKPVRNGSVSVHYLAKGMTWAPSYLIDVTDPEKATLTAKAAILNDIEDMENVQVDLVTGFPYMEFGEIISPLAKKEDLAEFLNALGTGASSGRGHGRYSAITAQTMSNVAGPAGAAGAAGRRGDAGAPAMPDYGTAESGEAVGDLFFYPVENVALKRGATGYYPLFTERVDYRHIYQWDIPDYLDAWYYWRYPYYGRRDDDQEQSQIVWHSVRLANSTEMPWTTAPAMTSEDGRLLGQSTLTYTPPDEDVMVKITQALGIRAAHEELEVNNEVNAMTHRGYKFDRLTTETTLTVRSHLKEPVTISITKHMTGTLKSANIEAEVKKLAMPVHSHWTWHLNPHSKLIWEVEIQPDEELIIKYTREALVRHH